MKKQQQSIAPLNAAELGWLAENLAIARSLIGASAEVSLEPTLLDRGLSTWRHQSDSLRMEPNAVANALGIAFGQCLVDGLSMEWAIVADAHGTELAVHGSPSDILVFPTAAAAKRISAGEASFFEELYQRLAVDILRIRRQSN
jgi:Domain of unknown function (DUF3806)